MRRLVAACLGWVDGCLKELRAIGLIVMLIANWAVHLILSSEYYPCVIRVRIYAFPYSYLHTQWVKNFSKYVPMEIKILIYPNTKNLF
jgi:hypothetical protein